MADRDPNPDDSKAPKPGRPAPPKMRVPRGVASWIGFILIALMIAMIVAQQYAPPESISIDEFRRITEQNPGRFKEIVISDDKITGTFKEEAPARGRGPAATNKFKVIYRVDRVDEIEAKLREKCPDAKITYEPSSTPYTQILIGIIPWLLIFGFVWFFIFRQLRSSAGGAGMLGNFGRSRHRVTNKEMTNVTFKDVAGVDEAKQEVAEIIEFLRNPKKFQRLGARIPRGVLLVGAPGCGKTLLAKAIAGEADVPFFNISGADFVEMFVGVGASRVRDLFKSAKESSPCIVFLDEIDAVGRRRGASFSGGGGHDEREQTLNAILVEMDGFDTSDQVIVMAATNRSDILDPALTRPGRFDRRVEVPPPDIKGRLEILKVHARKVKLSPTVDLMRLARGTPMFNGAELAAIINEAAIIATMQNKDMVELEDLEEARDKVRYGRSNKSRAIEEKERLATAYHEAGHAVLQTLLKDADPLHKVTIIPRGQALGATMALPEKDRYGYAARWLRATMRVLCAGRIAEQRHCNDVSSGAAMDIEQVTLLARTMVIDWGMSDKLGFVKYSPDARLEGFFSEKPYSDDTAGLIDEEIRRFIDEAYRDAQRMIDENWDKIEAVAQALLKHETLDADEVRRLCLGETLDKPSLSDILAGESISPGTDASRPPKRSPQPGHSNGLPGPSLPQPDVG